MKSILVTFVLAICYSSVSLAAAKPITSVWRSVSQKPANGILQIDLSYVDFSKPGHYPAPLETIYGACSQVLYYVDEDSRKNNLQGLDECNMVSGVEPMFVPALTEDGMKVFSPFCFQQRLGQPNAAEECTTYYK